MTRALFGGGPASLRIGRVVVDKGGHRVGVRVLGKILWFESPDILPASGAEAFVTSLLFPAMSRSVSLQSDVAVDPVLEQGLRSLVDLYHEWWGYPRNVVERLASDVETARGASSRVGMCFSGGVDSFYQLLESFDRIDALIFVHGFDIPLNDRGRWKQAERDFRLVCREFGKLPVVVRTNLRAHPVFRKISWERAHGAALAAAGHVVSAAIGTLIIPPSYRADRLKPWGSDPRTDPLYSSSQLSVVHAPCAEGRVGRIQCIVGHPSAHRFLRVCYENRRPSGNCSSCEKCVSTMCTLQGLGELDGFRVFDRSVPLGRRVDAIPCITHHSPAVWREVLALQTNFETAQAIERLLHRTASRASSHDVHERNKPSPGRSIRSLFGV